MTTVKTTQNGIDYLTGVLKDKARTITRVFFWKIPHDLPKEDICLKIGRYNKNDDSSETLFNTSPKSELTLQCDEFHELIDFLSENYEPFKKGVREYIPLDEKFDHEKTEHLKAIFANPDKEKLLSFIVENNILPEDLIAGLQNRARKKAIIEFEDMLGRNLLEQRWQEWFKRNDWVLGSEFVKILDEREIDSEHISDYLIQAYDGFLDIIEIKRPEGSFKFWLEQKDHGNYVPSIELTKAITQATIYLYEVEREANSIKFRERVGNVKTIKPRCVLIFGRSNNWCDEEREAYRILNSNYHNLTIMTYDHVLSRAKKIMSLNSDGAI